MVQGIAALALGLALVQGVESQAVEYYVGLDGREVIPTGTYAGLTNPNYGRLTFLYAHLNETDPTSYFCSVDYTRLINRIDRIGATSIIPRG